MRKLRVRCKSRSRILIVMSPGRIKSSSFPVVVLSAAVLIGLRLIDLLFALVFFLYRRMEESHDWLCSLADNAITASESEGFLKKLYTGLDNEKQRGVDSLHAALATYKEQHSAILDAIVVFTGRIHQHASDYLQREQLVSRAFLQYLVNIVSG